MSQRTEGKISFINHEKKYAMIEYEEGNKKKTVRAVIDEKIQKELKEKWLKQLPIQSKKQKKTSLLFLKMCMK